MSLYEVILQTTFAGQECINRWNYVGGGTPAAVTGSFALASAIGAIPSAGSYPANTLLKAIAGIMTPAAKFTLITVQNVYDPTDFYSTPFVPDFAGTQTGEALSPAVAIGYFSNRITRDIRRATKRFTAVYEGWNGEAGLIVAGAATQVALVATRMGETLSYDDEGNTLTFAPSVVSKEKYQSSEDPVRYAYRYYSTLSAQMSHVAQGISWDYYTHLRTQASRQYGRGR